MSAAAAETTGTPRDHVAWHSLSAEQASAQLGVDPKSGLDAGEVEKRRAQYGPNKLAEEAKEPGWHSFLRQYRDPVSYTHLTLPTILRV